MKTHSISNLELIHLLKPKEPVNPPTFELNLSSVFCDILQRANDFVPSEAGSIFLREQIEDSDEGAEPGEPMLVVAACFGDHASDLVGARLPAQRGIAGHVFHTGMAYTSAAPSQDQRFFNLFDRVTGFSTRSIVCLPLTVDRYVVGVLQLINRCDGQTFSSRELQLLEIFAQTISVSVANAVEAQRAREMARRDDLTRLYNDRYMHYRLTTVLEESLVGGHDCGIIFLDLDEFKRVNDSYGHLAGSRVLREIGDILRQVLPGPSIAARYGGDEFVIILPESSHQEVFWVAETVRKTIEDHVFLARPDLVDPVNYPALSISQVLTCSLGLATLRHDLIPLFGGRPLQAVAAKNEILRVADTRMYRAKERGKNLTVFNEAPAPEDTAAAEPFNADAATGDAATGKAAGVTSAG